MSARDPIPRVLSYQGVKAANPPDVILAKVNPNASDFKYPLGTFWINIITPASFQLIAQPGVWAPLSAAVGGPLTTLTGDAGVANPALNNINVIGGANISTTAAGDTLTINVFDEPVFTTVTTTSNILSGGNVIAATGVAAQTGGVVAQAGNIIAFDGDIIVAGAGRKFRVNGGTDDDSIGQATLVAGVATILNTNIDSDDRIFIQRMDPNGSVTLGELTYIITDGVSFDIKSVILGTPANPQVADVSIVSYLIVRQF